MSAGGGTAGGVWYFGPTVHPPKRQSIAARNIVAFRWKAVIILYASWMAPIRPPRSELVQGHRAASPGCAAAADRTLSKRLALYRALAIDSRAALLRSRCLGVGGARILYPCPAPTAERRVTRPSSSSRSDESATCTPQKLRR